MPRILSVSYDEALLYTRRLLLEAAGYNVTSAFGFKESLYQCKQGGFELFILGHSILLSDKQALIKEFRASCPGSILSLRLPSESDVEGADFYVDPDPENVLRLVAQILDATQPKRPQSSTGHPNPLLLRMPRKHI